MKISNNGIHINVLDQNHGEPTLVFLHYWGGSFRTWDAVVAALPQRYRFIRPDLRGWGDSDAPATGYALRDFASDVKQVIASLGVADYVLVGHSMGGKIAQLLASEKPAGLKGLILIAPAPPTPMAVPLDVRQQIANAYDSQASIEFSIDNVLTARPLTPSQRQQVIADSLRGGAQAKASWPLATSQEDISSTTAQIAVPTMVIAGEKDQVDSVATLKQELVSRLMDVTFEVLADTGHLSPLEAPGQIAALIQGFVTRLER